MRRWSSQPGTTEVKNFSRALAGILPGGLSAGALEIGYACVSGLATGRPVSRTLQSVASGVLGREAFQAGWPAIPSAG